MLVTLLTMATDHTHVIKEGTGLGRAKSSSAQLFGRLGFVFGLMITTAGAGIGWEVSTFVPVMGLAVAGRALCRPAGDPRHYG